MDGRSEQGAAVQRCLCKAHQDLSYAKLYDVVVVVRRYAVHRAVMHLLRGLTVSLRCAALPAYTAARQRQEQEHHRAASQQIVEAYQIGRCLI